MFDSLFPKEWTTLQRLMWLKTNALARAVYEIVTGNPVSFTAKAAPLKQLQIAFSPVQSGTGDPSPDNVRPISGWSSLTVEQRGKNLFPYADYPIYTYNWAVGQTYADAVRPILLKAGATYVLSLPLGVKLYRFRFFDKNKNAIDPTGKYAIFTSGTSTAISYYSSFKFCGYSNAIGSSSETVIQFSEDVYMDAVTENEVATPVQVEIGTTATEYVPYNPLSRSISITLGQTVYSGTVDVISGVGESVPCYDLGTLNWSYFARYDVFYTTDIKANGNDVDFMCSEYIKTSRAGGVGSLANGEGTYTQSALYLKNTNYTDAALFKASLNGVQFIAPSDTPIPIQLTPQEVESLAGDNTMWTDGDSLEVTYRSN